MVGYHLGAEKVRWSEYFRQRQQGLQRSQEEKVYDTKSKGGLEIGSHQKPLGQEKS